MITTIIIKISIFTTIFYNTPAADITIIENILSLSV